MTVQVDPMTPSLSNNAGPPPDLRRSGLPNNSLGAIAYFTIVPAILLLTITPAKKSSYVRFHAWQSILFNVVAYLIIVALGITLNYYGLFLYLSLRLFFLLGCSLVWRLCVIRAMEGKYFKLPVIGHLAELKACS
jgi:uncharacterized membrane protein